MSDDSCNLSKMYMKNVNYRKITHFLYIPKNSD